MKKVTIVGAGIMGTIFANALKSHYKVTVCERSDNKKVCQDSEMVIIAVKPQSFNELAVELRGNLDEAVVISIMAGVTIDSMKSALGVKKIVRAMPNLGARVGKSMTVWTSVGLNSRKEIRQLFKLLGRSLYVKNEDMIDKATAVSGSGPGFFYYIVEEWIEAVKNLGFSTKETELLLLTTLDGANEILQKEKKPKELIRQVASKGGTTEAGLNVLQKGNIKKLWNKTLLAAFRKVKEISL